jgi:hypothetical protein
MVCRSRIPCEWYQLTREGAAFGSWGEGWYATDLFLRNTIHIDAHDQPEKTMCRLTHARKSALVLTVGPFCRHIRRWFPPLTDSLHAPVAELPLSSRSSMIWFFQPLPSPKFAVCGAPRWTLRHSFALGSAGKEWRCQRDMTKK